LRQAAINNIATDFRRAASAKIADVLETASETNSADWDAFSSGLSTNNPLADIQPRVDAIIANNGTVNAIVSCGNVYSGFSGHTFINGALNKISSSVAGDAMTAMFRHFGGRALVLFGTERIVAIPKFSREFVATRKGQSLFVKNAVA